MNKPVLLRLLLGILAVYTAVEFYPFSVSLYFVPHYVVFALCLIWLALDPGISLIGAWNAWPVGFLVLWLGYNLASYAWALDTEQVLHYSVWILRYLVMFLIFSKLFTHYRYLEHFHWFLFGLMLLYLATAVWELVTFNHLPVSRRYGEIHYMPSGPFYQENHLAAYLLLFTPFLLFAPRLGQRRIWNYLSAAAVLVLVVVITIQGARIALLALGAFLVWYFFFQLRWRHRFVLLAVLLALSAGIYMKYGKEVRLVYSVLQFQAQSLGSEGSSIYMSSIQIRKQLVSEAFHLAAGTGFMGVGGGNFEPRLSGEAVFRTAGIINPHNYLMELFGNWGILILAAFVGLYLHWLLGLWRLYRRTSGQERLRYLMYGVSLLLFLPVSLLPSSIRWQYFIWIYFAAVNATLHTKSPLMTQEKHA